MHISSAAFVTLFIFINVARSNSPRLSVEVANKSTFRSSSCFNTDFSVRNRVEEADIYFEKAIESPNFGVSDLPLVQNYANFLKQEMNANTNMEIK